jgi:ribosomal protein S18 acetylase RimI-like enzyme
MRIRPATAADAATVTALWTEAYSGRAEGEGRVEPYEEPEFFAAATAGELAVAELEGEAVGVVLMRPPGAPGQAVALAGEAELRRLAVAAPARGRGIGRALARHCGEAARRTGAEALALWSRPYQVQAHRLYESLGYERIPGRDSDGPDGRRLVFRLDFAS